MHWQRPSADAEIGALGCVGLRARNEVRRTGCKLGFCMVWSRAWRTHPRLHQAHLGIADPAKMMERTDVRCYGEVSTRAESGAEDAAVQTLRAERGRAVMAK